MIKYFTKTNTYRYLDVLDKLLTGYNTSIHSTMRMPPSKVNPSNIYSVWQRMNSLWDKISQGNVKFKVMITKEKSVFGKGCEQTFSTVIFRVAKFILCVSQPVYESITSLSRSLIHPRWSLK
jgi:hypothetical protein